MVFCCYFSGILLYMSRANLNLGNLWAVLCFPSPVVKLTDPSCKIRQMFILQFVLFNFCYEQLISLFKRLFEISFGCNYSLPLVLNSDWWRSIFKVVCLGIIRCIQKKCILIDLILSICWQYLNLKESFILYDIVFTVYFI